MPDEQALAILQDLGLTTLQARVYLSLARLGTSTGRIVSRKASVAQQDVYHVLSELQEKGLVEKVIAKPNRYKAIVLEEGLKLLVKQRKERTEEIEKAANEIAREFPMKLESACQPGDFMIISEKEAIQKAVVKLFRTAQTSIYTINNLDEARAFYEKHENFMKEPFQKGVKVQGIYGNRKKEKLPTSLSNLLRVSRNFKAKFIESEVPVRLLVKDNNEALISTMIGPGSVSQPHLWTNNAVLVSVCIQWYNFMWQKII